MPAHLYRQKNDEAHAGLDADVSRVVKTFENTWCMLQMESYGAPAGLTARVWRYKLEKYAKLSDGELTYRRAGLYRADTRLTLAEIQAWVEEHMTLQLPTFYETEGWHYMVKNNAGFSRKRKGMHLYEGEKRLRVDEIIALEDRRIRMEKNWDNMRERLDGIVSMEIIVRDYGRNGAEYRISIPWKFYEDVSIYWILVKARGMLFGQPHLYSYMRPAPCAAGGTMTDRVGWRPEKLKLSLDIDCRERKAYVKDNDRNRTYDIVDLDLVLQEPAEHRLPFYRSVIVNFYVPYMIGTTVYFYIPSADSANISLYCGKLRRAGDHDDKFEIAGVRFVGTMPLGVIGVESRMPEDGHDDRRYGWPCDLVVLTSD